MSHLHRPISTSQYIIKGVIFDFDGVIIDSEPYWHIAKFRGFNDTGLPLSEEEVMQTLGKRIEEIAAEYKQKHGFSDEVAKKLIANIYERAQEEISKNALPINGLYDAINSLLKCGKTLAIASSSPVKIIIAALEKLQLRDAFKFVHSAEYERYGKPHPAVYLATSDMLDLNTNQCVVIEDSLTGLISAKAAKMRCVLIDEKKDKYFGVIADKVIGDLSEVDSELIRELEIS